MQQNHQNLVEKQLYRHRPLNSPVRLRLCLSRNIRPGSTRIWAYIFHYILLSFCRQNQVEVKLPIFHILYFLNIKLCSTYCFCVVITLCRSVPVWCRHAPVKRYLLPAVMRSATPKLLMPLFSNCKLHIPANGIVRYSCCFSIMQRVFFFVALSFCSAVYNSL